MRHLTLAATCMAALLVTSPAQAQMPPGGKMPSKQEIMQKIDENFPKLIEQAPEKTIEFEGVFKITYKAIPTDPVDVAKALGKELGVGQINQLPKEQVEQALGMYRNEIVTVLNKHLRDIGEFEALVEIKIKSSKVIPVGKHRFGIAFTSDKAVEKAVEKGVAINANKIGLMGLKVNYKTGKQKKNKKTGQMEDEIKTILIQAGKTKRGALAKAVALEAKPPKKTKKGKKACHIFMVVLDFQSRTKKPIVVTVDE